MMTEVNKQKEVLEIHSAPLETDVVKKAGWIALFFSLLMPIVGFVMYFLKRKEVVNAEYYLYAAIAGMVVGFVYQQL